MLRLDELKAWYRSTQALFGVSLEVHPGEVMAMVGPNGAGKTTIIRSILGLVATQGTIEIDGEDVTRSSASRRVRSHDIAVVHEGRGLFPTMSVRENLVVGHPAGRRTDIEPAVELFPVLGERINARASNLSGGQQQMVAIGRAVLREPRLLLLDEPSLGLAPSISDEIYDHLSGLVAGNLTVVLVEQDIARARSFANRLCLIRNGLARDVADVRDASGMDRILAAAFDQLDAEIQER